MFGLLIPYQVAARQKRDKRMAVQHEAELASSKLRRLSAWNVFQRQQLSDMGSLNPEEYKQAVASLSEDWNALPYEDKSAYEIQAQFEELARCELKGLPLGVKGEPKTQLEESVGTSALKKLSMGRLRHNFSNLDSDPLWSKPAQLGESCSPVGGWL